MIINKSPYSNGKVQVLYQYLQNAINKGRPIEYEIRVDDLKMVGRTNSLEEFDGYEEFVTEDTRTVTMIFYEGQSRRSTRHVLELNTKKEEPKESRELREIRQLREELSGLQDRRSKTESSAPAREIDFDEKLKNYRRDWDYEDLQKKYNELEKDLQQCRKEYEDLDKENDRLIEQIHEVKRQWESAEESSSLKQMFPKILEDILKGKEESMVLSGLSSLGGIFGAKENKPSLSGIEKKPNEQAEATFRKKETPGGEASFSEAESAADQPKEKQYVISEHDKTLLQSLKQALDNCNKEQVEDMVTLLECVAENPSVTKSALESSQSVLKQNQPKTE